MDVDPNVAQSAGTVANAAFTEHAMLAIASFCGGAVRLFLRPPDGKTFFERFCKAIWCVFCCIACGYFFAPIVRSALGLPVDWENGAAALLGLVGLSLAERVLLAVERASMKAWVARFLARGNEA